MGATPQSCPDIRYLRLHSVHPASPVMTAQLDALANLTSRFPLHKSHGVHGLRFFVVAHFNNISSIFRDWFRRIKTNRLPWGNPIRLDSSEPVTKDRRYVIKMGDHEESKSYVTIQPCLSSALFRTTPSSSYIANFML